MESDSLNGQSTAAASSGHSDWELQSGTEPGSNADVQTMASGATTSQLLALPDPCQLAVMHCFRDNTSSALSAVAAHSRLQRAAVEALSSISAGALDLARLKSLLQYLKNHGQQSGTEPGSSADDGSEQAESEVESEEEWQQAIHMAADTTTSRLLELPDPCLLAVMRCCADDASSVMKAATTHIRLQRAAVEALSSITAGALSELQHLTQLTHLDLGTIWGSLDGPNPPLTAYASLTASSRLQHLDFLSNTLPSAAWQHMCPPGRTLPQLRYLNISFLHEADSSWAAPDTSALVRYCPCLQSLSCSMYGSIALLAPLQRLTGLHTLAVGAGKEDAPELVQTLCQLTGLQELDVLVPLAAKFQALQLTQLARLTALTFPHDGTRKRLCFHSQDPASEPVWRQLLQLFLDSRDPEVAQQAAAALEAA